MDIEMDSDLDDIEVVDLGEVVIEPYLYEPIRVNRPDSERLSDESSDDESELDDLNFGIDQNGPEVNEWCQCGNCVTMDTADESKCCQTTNIVDGKIEAENLTCITQHPGFRDNCLSVYVLETVFYTYVKDQGPPAEGEFLHKLLRHLAYRQFTRWVYGMLGKRHRKVVPSCAVNAIRQAFPSDEYVGFKWPR